MKILPIATAFMLLTQCFQATAQLVVHNDDPANAITVWVEVLTQGVPEVISCRIEPGQSVTGNTSSWYPYPGATSYNLRWCCYNGCFINNAWSGPYLASMDGTFTVANCSSTNGYTPGAVRDRNDGPSCPPSAKCGSCPSGMPVWEVSEPYISLWLRDEPLGYLPALGPRVSFGLGFKQREDTAGFDTNIFSVGQKWNFSWFSYVAKDANNRSVVHYDSGAQRTFVGTNDYLSNTGISGATNTGFTVTYANGSKDVYGFIVTNGSGVFQKAFMTERWNSHGQKLTLNYYGYTPGSSPVIRLQNVVDGDGKTNLIYYTTNAAYSTNLIISVVDPFGRSNSLAYDSNGHLTNLVDVAGIPSSFLYDSGGCVTNLITPYGQTRFQITESPLPELAPNGRSVRVLEPDGSAQLFLYTNGAPGIANSYTTNEVPDTLSLSNTFENTNLDSRNTFHWGTLQYSHLSTTNIGSLNTNDFRRARMQHWLSAAWGGVGETVSVIRDPSIDDGGLTAGQKSWFDYAGKTNSNYEGTQVLPLYRALVLADGTTSFERFDRNNFGNVVTNISTYSSAGSVALRTNIFVYDATAGIDLLKVTNALGVQVSSNAYNAYHQITTNLNALNEPAINSYNGNQQLITTVFANGLITTNIYGTDNWLATNFSYAIVSGSPVYFGTNTFTYANDLVLAHTDARELTTTNTWDNLQRLLKTVYPDGTFITNTYDKLDLVKTIDRMGFSNSFGYDAARRLIVSTNANGVVTGYEYCTCGSLASVTNAFATSAQAVTQFFYDNQGKRTNTLYADGYSVTGKYDLPGRLTNVVDSGGVSITNWFNNQGLQYAASNSFGQVSASIFDILDRVTTNTDANGVTMTNSYDDLHRVLVRGYPDGGTERFVYTVKGLVTYTNQLNQPTMFDYDAHGRKITETNANLEVTHFAYRAAGDLLTLTDGKSQNTSWNYDKFGLVTNKVDHTSTEILRYKYDADSRLTNRYSIAKGDTYYAYDKVGNLTNTTYPVSPSISLAYDALNHLTNMIDAVGTSKYGYNAAGQLLSEDGPWSDDMVSYSYANRLRSGMSLLQPNAAVWSQTYGYDSARRLTNTTSPAGAFGYAYDGTAEMLVKKLTEPSGAYITNSFDGNARLLSTVLKNSSHSTINSHSYQLNQGNQRTNQTFTDGNYVRYDYDPIGQLTSAVGKEVGGTTNRLQEQLAYGYDAAHNLSARTNNGLVQTFGVNSLNELTNITRTGTFTVAGTSTSSATGVTVNGNSATLYSDKTFAKASVSLGDGNNTFTAIASDALGRSDTNAVTAYLPATNVFVYDLNGNMTSDGKRAFDYDDEDQLIRITATNAWKSEFTYDGKMRMRIRKEFTWNGAWIQSQEVHYVYDGNLAIQERDQNNTPRVSYTRGTDLSSSFQGAGGIGGLLARTDNSVLYVDPSSAHAYYHADGNGNITALLNSFQGFAAKYNYDPFGNILSQSGHLADANLYRFSSKESHPNSGLVYYLYRFYSSAHQRWLNKDPLGEAGGFNLYGFARNDLISGIDPLGLTGSSVLAAVETGVPSQAEIAAMVAEGNALLAPQAAVGPGVFGAGTTGVLATSVAEVGVGTVLVGGTVAVGVGGAIGLGASQLPVVGGGTVADFWGGVLYDTFWPRPGPVRMPTPVRAKVPFVEVSPEQLAGWVELPIREVRDRCGSGKCSCVASCQNHISGNGIGWVFGFASARDCHTAAQLAAKMAANSAAQGTSVRHCKARCAPL